MPATLVAKMQAARNFNKGFDTVEFARRTRIKVHTDGASLWIKSAEDSVLRKLWWFEQGGRVSERQWRDAVAVLRVGGAQLESEYMRKWAGVIGVADLLERARAEAEL